MKNRFSSGRNPSPAGKIIRNLSFLLFAALFCLFIYGVNSVSASAEDRQQESLETAIQRDIVHCYAIEGTYPPSLDYMKEHYGLTYDTNDFFVDYQPIGSNVLPNVTVIRLDGKKDTANEAIQK